jgi:(1->4)-alpha-D-glucan 1-alpha-D-glucosylmutase
MKRPPLSTYRLQFGPQFGFARATEVLPYLSLLGLTDIYASPVFRPRSGSGHGYDVVDYDTINPELGGRAGLEEVIGRAAASGLGWIQDFVPNHMAYHSENGMLMEVLENGPESRFAPFFDVDWDHQEEGLKGKILAPFLGRFFGTALEQGEIRLAYDRGEMSVETYGLRFPLRIESYTTVFEPALARLEELVGRGHPYLLKLNDIRSLPASGPGGGEGGRREERAAFIKNVLWEFYSGHAGVRGLVDDNLARLNGRPGDPQSFDDLEGILARQFYRLSFWKVAAEELNYRRFFNINDLIALRLESPGVFERTHSLLLELVRKGLLSGLRLDHIDGLYDPRAYLDRVRAEVADLYVVVEKILQPGEDLPVDWPVQGTTGYDWLNQVNGVLCRPEGGGRLETIYSAFTGRKHSASELRAQKKRLVVGQNMAGDIANLARLIKRISGLHRRAHDFTSFGLRRALVEILAQFPVYRTYPREGRLSESDRARVQAAIRKAKLSVPALLHELDFIQDILLLNEPPGLGDAARAEWQDFALRCQQLLAPVAAKGIEDTFLYVYNRLLSLNEVGGDPARVGISAAAFHRFNAERAERWPRSMNATSTHDTKRGEDVRARLNVLSDIPDEWRAAVTAWRRLNRRHKRTVNGLAAPDRNDEYFLYQTLVGAYPFEPGQLPSFRDRVAAYMVKAVREAKVHTAWLKPDEEYEAAVLGFVAGILDEAPGGRFLEAFRPFQARVAFYGLFNSLSQVLLKIASPGVPDFYQGTELWDLSLVDPDNRRPVDFPLRRAVLEDISRRWEGDRPGLFKDLWSSRWDGRLKLFVTWRALTARRERAELFARGGYLPLDGQGARAANLLAFARRLGDDWVVCLVPRFVASLVQPEELPVGPGVWGDTGLNLPDEAPRRWEDALTGKVMAAELRLAVSEVLDRLPLALLLGRT